MSILGKSVFCAGAIIWLVSVVTAFVYSPTAEAGAVILFASALGFLLWAGLGYVFLMAVTAFGWGLVIIFPGQPIAHFAACGAYLGAWLALVVLT
jgi:hypothetical protein